MIYLQELLTAFLERFKLFLAQLNWVDLVGIVVVTRTLYIGLQKGLLIEIFKVFALGGGLVVAVTQYRRWGALLSEKIAFPLPVVEGVTFLLLFLLGYWALLLIRFLFMKIVTVQIGGVWDRVGGGLVGLLRGCLWLVVLEGAFLCLTPTSGYVAQSIREKSFFGPHLLAGGKATYQIANRTSTSFTIEKFEQLIQENKPRSP